MSFEKFKRIVTGVANTTVKKAGEQVQITKLDLEKATIEREIKEIYTEIGRHCYSQIKEGVSFDNYVVDCCASIDERAKKIVALETRIAAHKIERDTAEYAPIFADETSPEFEVEVVYDDGTELRFEEEETVAAEEVCEAAEEVCEAAAEVCEEVCDTLEEACETLEEKIEK